MGQRSGAGELIVTFSEKWSASRKRKPFHGERRDLKKSKGEQSRGYKGLRDDGLA